MDPRDDALVSEEGGPGGEVGPEVVRRVRVEPRLHVGRNAHDVLDVELRSVREAEIQERGVRMTHLSLHTGGRGGVSADHLVDGVVLVALEETRAAEARFRTTELVTYFWKKVSRSYTGKGLSRVDRSTQRVPEESSTEPGTQQQRRSC